MAELLENRYRIIRELAEGGFGKTFIAEDTQMPSHRRCVIKELKPINEGSQIYQLVKDRFHREAVILEDLGNNHSQIPSLYAHFSSEDKFYLVQEYIEGETLAERVQKRGKLSESEVKIILLKLLGVLEYIHSKKIIHRDIKPENIILRSGDDTPVLIDFGAVREIMGTVMSPSGNSTSSIVIGTPGYMPSEQLAGRPIFASDLYALGLTMIYALTSKIPSELTTDPLTGKIGWLQGTFASPTIANVLDRAIALYPQERFATATMMLQALHNKVPTTTVLEDTLTSVQPIPAPTEVINPQPNNVNYPSPPPNNNQNQNNNLTGLIITVLMLFGFTGLGYFMYQQNQLHQLEMAKLETERQKAEEEKQKAETERLAKEEALAEETRLRQEAEVKRQQEIARRQAAEAEAIGKQQSIVINTSNLSANTNASIGGKPGTKNIRSGSGTNYGVVASAPTGDRLLIVGQNRDRGGYLWYQVYHPNSGATGWIASQLVNLD